MSPSGKLFSLLMKLNPQYFTFSVRFSGSVRGEFAPGAVAASHGTKCTLKFIPFSSPECGRAQEGKLPVPQTGGSCWQNLPRVVWVGWTGAGSRAGAAGTSSFLLLHVHNLILSASPCSLMRKLLASVSSKVCLTLLPWECHWAPGGFGEKWGKFPLSRNKLQYL